MHLSDSRTQACRNFFQNNPVSDFSDCILNTYGFTQIYQFDQKLRTHAVFVNNKTASIIYSEYFSIFAHILELLTKFYKAVQ